MTVTVLKPGLMTTVQDQGRPGYQKNGVSPSGVMDRWALRLANVLVGNNENAACLEITLLGPSLYFNSDEQIAIAGADLTAAIGGSNIPLYRPVWIKKGQTLTFGHPKTGCRAYLAFAGGIEVPVILGSRSTFLPAGFGGFHGRKLHVQDVLSIGKRPNSPQTAGRFESIKTASRFLAAPWTVAPSILPYRDPHLIHIIKGSEWDLFAGNAQERLLAEPFTISPQANRMGYRLEGPLLKMTTAAHLVSAPVSTGTIQVPAGGRPIILLADRQTTGGYPKIAHVISADLPKLAQAKPGDRITFQMTTMTDAQKRLFDQETRLEFITARIHEKRKGLI